jgi:hypothetical protein
MTVTARIVAPTSTELHAKVERYFRDYSPYAYSTKVLSQFHHGEHGWMPARDEDGNYFIIVSRYTSAD